jgi:(4S)-4-hydroxy-5-phosphonooxypentane-2,3-dione isomerase
VLNVVALYKAKLDQGDSVAAALAKHVAATRDEPGCLGFVAYRSRSDPDRFVLCEHYTDEAAFEAHRASPHFQRYVQGMIAPVLDERTFAVYDEVVAET